MNSKKNQILNILYFSIWDDFIYILVYIKLYYIVYIVHIVNIVCIYIVYI